MTYVFANCAFDTCLYTLHRGGRVIRLRPKVFQVLLYLLEHRDRVISKHELAEQVWPKQSISDTTLESCMKAVRQTIGDSGHAQQLIQTRWGYGYRFIGAVEERPEVPPEEEAVTLPLGPPAVTPLRDLSGETCASAPPAPAGVSRLYPGEEFWRCPACQHVQPLDPAATHWVCPACSTLFWCRCPQCGVALPPQAHSCTACGIPLPTPSQPTNPLSMDPPNDLPHEQPAPSTPSLPLSGAPNAERRQLTVMVCDLVDSPPLAGHLDPEDLYDVLRTYQEMCAGIIGHFDGHIAQDHGERMVMYFGYPQAHEDDAQRAIRSGLEIIEAVATLNTRLEREHGIRLAVRLGIHTGVVVVGALGGERQHALWAVGETPHLAAQVQGFAAPDTLIISGATHRLVQGYFTCQDLGTQMSREMATPLQAYRVLRGSGAQHRLDVAAPRGLTPLVGRECEVALLLECWAQIKEGLGHIVMLSGEAGIGKSRLVQTLKEHLAAEPHARLEWRCSPYDQQSALHPVMAHLHHVLRWHPEEAPAEKLCTLEEALESYGFALLEVVPLFASLLSLPLPERYPPLLLTPQRQKQKTLEALLAWLLKEAARQPVLFIVEDLHWVDPSTLEFLDLLIAQVPLASLLIVLVYRPEFQPPWGGRTHLTPIVLHRLSRSQVEVMVERVTGGKRLPAAILQQVVTRTDGVPLFVEEITKAVLESGLLREAQGQYTLSGALPTLAIPTTLQDALMARLDRLAPEKAVAQLGATLGRTFSYELLQAISPMDDATLQQALGRLVEAELLYQHGVLPQTTYTFKHALIQDAAYQSLLKRTRQQYHRQIAEVLVKQFPDTTGTQPELLAHHYTEAGLSRQAVAFWQQAGQRAMQRSTHVEAIAHLTRGLEVLKTLPDTVERAQQELTLQMTLGASLMATKGYAVPEVEQAYSRARELCQQVGERAQLRTVLRGLSSFYVVRAELQIARELAEQCLTLAQRTLDTPALLWAHYALGMTLFHSGEMIQAWTHLEQSLALYDPQKRRSHRALVDPGVACPSYASWILWMLGYPDQALHRNRAALALAQRLSHPFSLAWALYCASVLHQLRQEPLAVQEHAEAMIACAHGQGFPFWVAAGTILRGWALAAQGQGEEGIVHLQHGLAAWRATGAELLQPYCLALLADAYGKTGQTEAGLAVLTEALAAVEHKGERFYEAELYRLRGELLLQSAGVNPHAACSLPSSAEAEACFHQALRIAQRQRAKPLELRAAMSLSRVWQSQGRCAEARQLLAETYGWFTEGFDTADIREARAALGEAACIRRFTPDKARY